MGKRFIDINTVAAQLETSRSTVERLIQDGDLVAVRLRPGGNLRILRSSYAAYCNEIACTPSGDDELTARVAAKRRARNAEIQGEHILGQLNLLKEDAS